MGILGGYNQRMGYGLGNPRAVIVNRRCVSCGWNDYFGAIQNQYTFFELYWFTADYRPDRYRSWFHHVSACTVSLFNRPYLSFLFSGRCPGHVSALFSRIFDAFVPTTTV